MQQFSLGMHSLCQFQIGLLIFRVSIFRWTEKLLRQHPRSLVMASKMSDVDTFKQYMQMLCNSIHDGDERCDLNPHHTPHALTFAHRLNSSVRLFVFVLLHLKFDVWLALFQSKAHLSLVFVILLQPLSFFQIYNHCPPFLV